MTKEVPNFRYKARIDGKKVYSSETVTEDGNLSLEIFQRNNGVLKRVYQIEAQTDGNELLIVVYRVSDFGGDGDIETVISQSQSIRDIPDNVEWL